MTASICRWRKAPGVATYTRMLAQIVRDLGYEVGVVYASTQTPPKDRLLREVAFFDEKRAIKTPLARQIINCLTDQVRELCPDQAPPGGVRRGRRSPPVRDDAAGAAPGVRRAPAFRQRPAAFCQDQPLCQTELRSEAGFFHCTYPMPLRANSARNIYTIHDLVPLRLPFTTLDNKRQMFRVLKKIARQADHIVTVSENSKRDIIELLGVDEIRVTNTYQAVHFPEAYRDRPDAVIAEQLKARSVSNSANICCFSERWSRRRMSAA